MSPASIPIQGTFDAAVARNVLRKEVSEHNWVPAFRVRASAALTALTETILLSQTSAVLTIKTVERGGNLGVQLICDVNWHAAREVWLEQTRLRLTRAADDLRISEQNGSIRIEAWVWPSASDGQ